MNIVLLQAASGSMVTGPNVRVPPGNYVIEKKGSFLSCSMFLNNSPPIEVNSKVILSNPSTIKLEAVEAQSLTVRFIRED